MNKFKVQAPVLTNFYFNYIVRYFQRAITLYPAPSIDIHYGCTESPILEGNRYVTQSSFRSALVLGGS